MRPIPAYANRQERRFNPLVDPDLLGLFYAETATDNGTTLTVPNQKSGGTACTATTAGRPTIGATAIEGTRPGIVMGSIGTGGELTCAGASLSGKTAFTLYMIGSDTTSTLSRLWTYGAGNQNALSFYNNGAIGRHDTQKADETGTNTLVSTAFQRGMAAVSRVTAFRCDINVVGQEILPVYQDGVALSGSYSLPADTSGTFATGPWVIGSNFTGASPFKGALNAWAMIGRAHTDLEVAQWTAYFRARIGTRAPVYHVYTGDSLTVNGDGWRKGVYDTWVARNDNDRWYRAQGPSVGAGFAADMHYGVSGRTIAQLAADIGNVFGSGKLFTGANDGRKKLIPVMIGTNDISGGGTAGTLATPYGNLFAAIHALEPDATLVAMAPFPRTDVYAANSAAFNAALQASIVPAMQASNIPVFFDDSLATTPGLAYTDGIHPTNAASYAAGVRAEPFLRALAGVAP